MHHWPRILAPSHFAPLVLVLYLLVAETMIRADGSEEGPAPSFTEVILPLLRAQCISCHGPDVQEGGLRLDSFDDALKGGDRGSVFASGDMANSLMIQAVSFVDPDLQMPPKNKLSDDEISLLTQWVLSGAEWTEPATVLFDENASFLQLLTSGNGNIRILKADAYSGNLAFGITPLQRDAVNIPGWDYPIRETPGPGEYRYLRMAWKKQGAGSIMLELAANGRWPEAATSAGRYVAGPNTTGWSAISVAEAAPTEWTVVTLDLWNDLGDVALTGLAPTCDAGDEAFFDAILLAPSLASLDTYEISAANPTLLDPIGDAFTDLRNPVRKAFRGERLDLWSLRPLQPSVPRTQDNLSSAKTTLEVQPLSEIIDAHVDSRLQAVGLTHSPEADKRTLLRRLYYDLTGLPPTEQEVQQFLADQSEHAYEKRVDALLASKHYGERQARLWLDVVRYADTHGYERDEFRPLMWRYRDYVVRAFNDDKPYDRFVCEQLAGDELVESSPRSSEDQDALIATGFLRLGQWDSTAAIFQEEERLRAEMLADLTNTTASAFLGLTMSCCQCHDHKFDPFLQADHYRLRAFFANTQPKDDLILSTPEEHHEIEMHNAMLDSDQLKIKDEIESLSESDSTHKAQLTEKIAQLHAARRSPELAYGAIDAGPHAPATLIFYQGDFHSPREPVEPGFLSVFDPSGSEVSAPRNNTTGRRLALAQWIVSADNPWTSRVIVNRIWQQHFGTGIVSTANDFGFSGGRPSHPELLDELALQFMASGWSIKQLHRQIVISQTYRQSSQETQAGLLHDPENRLLHRQTVRRLDAESLRDSLLSVSGLLLPYQCGPPRWPEVPEELLYAQPAILEAIEGKDEGRQQGWYAQAAELTDVRSLFLIRKRCLPIPFLQVFDLPDTTVSCARRDATVVAPQSLTLLNSPESIRCAVALADSVILQTQLQSFDSESHLDKVITFTFQTVLQRAATESELTLASDFLKRHRAHHAETYPNPIASALDQASRQAVIDLCRAMLNLNEFTYID